MIDKEYNKILKQYHKLSDRHILVAETDMPYSDVLKVVNLSDQIRKAGNELVGLMRKNYYQLMRTKKYRKLLFLYGNTEDKNKRKIYANQLNEMQKAYHSREVPIQPDMEAAAKETDTANFLDLLPRELSEQDRQLIYLHCEMGLPHEEIAAMLGCSPVACRMRFSRARNRCQKILLKEKNINYQLHSTLFDKYKE